MSATASKQQTENETSETQIELIHELELENGFFYKNIYKVAEIFASTAIGQYVIGKIDELLRILEYTAKWSLPQHKKNSSHPPRPLPWIPFLILILFLRILRTSLSFGGLLIGNRPLTARDVIYFIQTRRRKIRALKYSGARNLRLRKGSSNSRLFSFNIRSMLSMFVCYPKSQNDLKRTRAMKKSLLRKHKGKRAAQNEPLPIKCTSSPKSGQVSEDCVSDPDLTLNEMIERCREENSDDDPDFDPTTTPPDQESSSESSTPIRYDNNGEEIFSFTENCPEDSLQNETSVTANGFHALEGSTKPESNDDKVEEITSPAEVEVNSETLSNDVKNNEMQDKLVENKEQRFDIGNNAFNGETTSGELDPVPMKDFNGHIKEWASSEGVKLNEETFVTPDSSVEDLFYSPVGSQILEHDSSFNMNEKPKSSPDQSRDDSRGSPILKQESSCNTNEDWKSFHDQSRADSEGSPILKQESSFNTNEDSKSFHDQSRADSEGHGYAKPSHQSDSGVGGHSKSKRNKSRRKHR